MPHEIINKFKEIIGSDPIFSVRAAVSPLFMIFTWQDYLSKNPLHIFCINKERDSYILLNDKRYVDIAKDRFRQYFNGEVTLEHLQQEYFDYENTTQAMYDELVEIDLEKISNDNLFSYFKKLEPIAKQLADITIYVENVDQEKILDVVGKENQVLLERVWDRATEAVFVSFEQRRIKRMLDLINVENSINKVKFIFTDYFWITEKIDIVSVMDKLKKDFTEKEKEYVRTKNISDIKLKEHTEWIKTLDRTSARIALFMQWVMYMRDIRKDPIAQLQTMMADLSIEIMKRIGLEEKYASKVIYHEYLKGFEYISSIKENIKERLNGCIYLAYPNYSFITEVCDFSQTVRELEAYIEQKNYHVGDLSGQIACRGKVSGAVRVIFDPKDDKGFSTGDILVTSMTRPEFVPLMKKAGAVVTNEGGITCHAAIISRELNIPCIIGTKFATQVLKDGDLVEVDADNGVVKIIK
jgi:phosphohistidine swiveling domain-containing protein